MGALALTSTSSDLEELLSSLPLVSVSLLFVDSHSLPPCLLGEGAILHKLFDQLLRLLPITCAAMPPWMSIWFRIHYSGLVAWQIQLLQHFC